MKKLVTLLFVVGVIFLLSAGNIKADGSNDAECPYKNTGSSQPVTLQRFEWVDGKVLWGFNPKETKCAWAVEGRFPWQPAWNEHHIVEGSSERGSFDFTAKNTIIQEKYGIPNKFLNWMLCKECSVWEEDSTWNICDVTTEKPPICYELEAAKYQVMKQEKYLFPRIVHEYNDSIHVFKDTSSGTPIPESCWFAEPEEIPIHGLFDKVTGKYNAAIGALNCTTVAMVDGIREQWNGQRDNERKVVFTTIRAWLLPDVWTDNQKNSWNPPTN